MAPRVMLTLLLLLTTAQVSLSSLEYVLHEQRFSTSVRWAQKNRVPPSTLLPVRIGLAQQNLDVAAEHLMNVAEPTSPMYGKHWTAEEVIKFFEPTVETVESVREWLVTAGIHNESITHSDNRVWLAFFATTEKMESLLRTEYWEYEDQNTGGIVPACERYYLPASMQKHIDFVTPGIRLLAPTKEVGRHPGQSITSDYRSSTFEQVQHAEHPNLQSREQLPHDLKHCDISMTPACISALYRIPPAKRAHKGNSLGIFEEGLQRWNQENLDGFFASYANWIPNGTHPVNRLVDGGKAETTEVAWIKSFETQLDLDMAYPIVYPQTITLWHDDDTHYGSWQNNTYTWGFNTLLDAIDGSYCTYCAYGECGDLPGIDPTYPDPEGWNHPLQCGVYQSTNVISLSYGGQEADVPIAWQKRQCNEYLKLGLQGVSIIFSSGDDGVGFNGHPTVSGPKCLGKENRIFNPTWPANCPWVTAAGWTEVKPGETVRMPESAAESLSKSGNYSSGGGFSNVYSVPSYQKDAVKTFFTDHDPPYPHYSGLVTNSKDLYRKPHVEALVGSSDGVYNRIGRGIPDVAANGLNGAFYVYGQREPNAAGGSSMAAPIFASIINRINEERLAAGKSVVGFINPALYAHSDVLNDITQGHNPGCGTDGFKAVKGWDPVTGLGTPDYPSMLKLFMSLP